MSPGKPHAELREALAEEALEVLDGAERAELLAHVDGCAECREELAELRAAAGAMAYAAPPASLDPYRSARIRTRLLARAAAAPPPATAPVADLAARREARPPGGWWAAAAAVALLLGAGGYALALRERVERLSGRLTALEAEREDLAGEVAAHERTLAELAGREVRVIDLAAAGPRSPSGRMFWNPGSGTWTFFAHGLPPVDHGRVYQLWLVTPGRKLGAGTFTPGADGMAVVQARFDLPPDSLRAVAVTEEPAGGVPQPTGAPVIAGAHTD